MEFSLCCGSAPSRCCLAAGWRNELPAVLPWILVWTIHVRLPNQTHVKTEYSFGVRIGFRNRVGEIERQRCRAEHRDRDS